MAKFEIPIKPKKKKDNTSQQGALGPFEIERETCGEEHELMYRDLEQEVKDAELEKAQRSRRKKQQKQKQQRQQLLKLERWQQRQH